ncbi:unnamed protein product, partial [Rotaria sp. Silwood1]
TGEWIVVLNRAGAGRREMINADELVTALLKAFPDHSNPYLRVWPKQFNFDDNLYETARMARSIRLLFGVHGAGLSNAVFMRPGAILYEVNPYGCRHLSFNFHRWADVFNLQHALWIPSQGNNGRTNNYCERESSTTLNVKEIINEMKSLLKDEVEYRSATTRRPTGTTPSSRLSCVCSCCSGLRCKPIFLQSFVDTTCTTKACKDKCKVFEPKHCDHTIMGTNDAYCTVLP